MIWWILTTSDELHCCFCCCAAAAARDDNVFYDSGREGRKIAHRSTFKTRTFSYATFPRPKCRAIKRDVLLFFIIFPFLIEQHFTSAEVTPRRRRRRRRGGETATVYQKSEARTGVRPSSCRVEPLTLNHRASAAAAENRWNNREVKRKPAACTVAE